MASPEELIGLIGGLAGAIRDQHTSTKEVTATTLPTAGRILLGIFITFTPDDNTGVR